MPTRPTRRATVAALCLSSLLLATSISALPTVAQDVGPGGDVDPGADGAVTTLDLDGADDALACAPGFDDIHVQRDMALHGVALTSVGAVAVGFTRRRKSTERRRPAAIYRVADAWTRVGLGSPGREDGLVAVSAGGGADAWAVGFTTIRGRVMPLATRWNGRRWKVSRPMPPGPLAAMFTDVTILGGGDPFAVGYRMTGDGRRLPIAARKDGRRWRYFDPRVGRRVSVTLTGVARDLRGGLWVVGHGGSGAQIGPVVYRRDGGRWSRQPMPTLAGEAVLTDVESTSADEAWAVGYQRVRDRSLPLVMRWAGGRWRRAEAPTFHSQDVVLSAVSAAPSGGVWVVGAAWNAEIGSHQAVAAWWDGQAWDEVAGLAGGDELHDVVGSLDADGWAVGRAGREARTTRVCTPLQAGIFGGSEPVEPIVPGGPEDLVAGAAPAADPPAAEPPAGGQTAGVPGADPPAADAAATVGRSGADGDEVADAQATGSSTLTRKGRQRARAKGRQGGRPKRQRRPRIPSLPKARRDRAILARDVAAKAGIAESTNTYGAVVADFDGDGMDDLYIGRHGRPGRLLLNRGGRFEDIGGTLFPAIDRHGCAAADIDGSGLPDLYCALGGKRGTGLKSNELWIDPAGPGAVDAAMTSGVADPMGRGRDTVFLESRDALDTSLVVTNSPTRVDGLPSPGRLYRLDEGRRFQARTRPGFAARLGSLSLGKGDLDADGREDLVLVTGGPQSPRQEGTRLYRNTRRGLVDVTRRMGVRSFGEVDAELVDIDRDRRLDLVQLSPDRLRVSVQSKGRFRVVYERRLRHGHAMAAGDVNGDGRDDLFIMRSDGGRNRADVLLVNRGRGGRRWTSMRIPQATGGDGDDAVAIDHDGNGLEDFVVLNGRTRRGPIQLIAFYER